MPRLMAGDPVRDLSTYKERGGGEAFALALDVGAAAVVGEITASGLRGRGGGGFPTGQKWTGIRDAGEGRRFAVCNAAEGEPGTFKDRALLRHNPYQVLEGLAIAALAVGAEAAFIATKASYTQEADQLATAIDEMRADGGFGQVAITLVLGPDEYLFGEEKALLEVIEGRDPLPRLFPPYQHGLFATDIQTGWESTDSAGQRGQANPTLVNNVETLANIPPILRRGADWFRAVGTAESPGTIVATVLGDVRQPLVVEVEMGTPLSELLTRAGGPRQDRSMQACVSGVANAVIAPSEFDAPVSYEGMAAIGSGLGSAGFVFYDDSACMVEVARALSRFLYVESCGQCRSCKFGCGEITRALESIASGTGEEHDVAVIGARLKSVTDQVRCYLATEEQILIASLLREFSEEFALHLEGRCSVEPRAITVPKIVDLADGVVTYDLTHDRKQPDWTYLPA
jgi:NADH:ubiquinone oxidoreductase subunit F (NADH-binding)